MNCGLTARRHKSSGLGGCIRANKRIKTNEIMPRKRYVDIHGISGRITPLLRILLIS